MGSDLSCKEAQLFIHSSQRLQSPKSGITMKKNRVKNSIKMKKKTEGGRVTIGARENLTLGPNNQKLKKRRKQ